MGRLGEAIYEYVDDGVVITNYDQYSVSTPRIYIIGNHDTNFVTRENESYTSLVQQHVENDIIDTFMSMKTQQIMEENSSTKEIGEEDGMDAIETAFDQWSDNNGNITSAKRNVCVPHGLVPLYCVKQTGVKAWIRNYIIQNITGR